MNNLILCLITTRLMDFEMGMLKLSITITIFSY
jgi:hypothetical protein